MLEYWNKERRRKVGLPADIKYGRSCKQIKGDALNRRKLEGPSLTCHKTCRQVDITLAKSLYLFALSITNLGL